MVTATKLGLAVKPVACTAHFRSKSGKKGRCKMEGDDVVIRCAEEDEDCNDSSDCCQTPDALSCSKSKCQKTKSTKQS